VDRTRYRPLCSTCLVFPPQPAGRHRARLPRLCEKVR
jgi:hypothetical protein